MTSFVVSPIPIYIQETLDLYADPRCRVTLLKPNECGRKVVAMIEKYGDLTRFQRSRYPYIQMILSMQREIVKRRGQDKRYYPGLPCYRCFELIPIYSKCVVKKGGRRITINVLEM